MAPAHGGSQRVGEATDGRPDKDSVLYKTVMTL